MIGMRARPRGSMLWSGVGGNGEDASREGWLEENEEWEEGREEEEKMEKEEEGIAREGGLGEKCGT